jgi:hypothetical protein
MYMNIYIYDCKVNCENIFLSNFCLITIINIVLVKHEHKIDSGYYCKPVITVNLLLLQSKEL